MFAHVPDHLWNKLSTNGKRAWVKVPPDNRDILLSNGEVATKSTPSPGSTSPSPGSTGRTPRSTNLHETSAYDFIVNHLMAEHDPGPTETNLTVSTNSHDTTASETTIATSNTSSLHPADVRRFLANQSTSKRSVNMARRKYTVSSHKSSLPGAPI